MTTWMILFAFIVIQPNGEIAVEQTLLDVTFKSEATCTQYADLFLKEYTKIYPKKWNAMATACRGIIAKSN